MTSEERAKQFLDQAEPTLYAYDLEFLTSQFAQHAADQREIDIKALRNVCQHFMGHSFNTGSLALLEDAILNTTGERI